MDSEAKKNLFISGITSFVGNSIVNTLSQSKKYLLKGSVRQQIPQSYTSLLDQVVVASLDACTNWQEALIGSDVVIHTAARVHVMKDSSLNPLEEFRRVNVVGTLNLARQAVDAGVRRFIFLSSIKVNGESTEGRSPFCANDVVNPVDSYAVSKMEAEEGLFEIAKNTGLEVVIIRPPLVYGPGVKANFLSLMRWLHRGIPLPFGAVYNRRSLVALDNLVNLIDICIHHPAAANQIFMVSDGEDLSTTELLQRLGSALERPARLISVPKGVLWGIARILRQQDSAQRVLESLQIDISKTRQLLDWKPPVSVDFGLKKTAKAFLAEIMHF